MYFRDNFSKKRVWFTWLHLLIYLIVYRIRIYVLYYTIVGGCFTKIIYRSILEFTYIETLNRGKVFVLCTFISKREVWNGFVGSQEYYLDNCFIYRVEDKFESCITATSEKYATLVLWTFIYTVKTINKRFRRLVYNLLLFFLIFGLVQCKEFWRLFW